MPGNGHNGDNGRESGVRTHESDPLISAPLSLSIAQALQTHTQLNSDSARLDVECLLCHVLSCESAYLRTWPEKHLTQDQSSLFFTLLERRQRGEPIAHICGKRAFWTLSLKVTPDTLIPRPDTEILIEQILDLPLPANANVLDLGTGTGAIALALASERPDWQIQACDFRAEIVRLAQENAAHHQLGQVRIFQSDWFSAVGAEQFELIVSNPPYIDPEDQHLNEGDVRFEPHSALTAKNKGLADLTRIIQQAPGYLKEGGWLVLEHGYDQALAVQSLFKENGFHSIHTKKDYGQQDRMTMARYSLTR